MPLVIGLSYFDKIEISSSFDGYIDFSFPIVNFPFISSNIPTSPAYGVCISQLICDSRGCAQFSDCLDGAQLLTQKLLKQGYVAPRMKSSLQIFYGRHHNLVDRCEISISQITMDLLYSRKFVLSSMLTRHDYLYE